MTLGLVYLVGELGMVRERKKKLKTIQSRNRKRGKKVEGRHAKAVGGKRVGLLGGEDVWHHEFSIERKSREKFVAEKWMLQAEDNAPKKKLPIVIVHITGKKTDNDLVLMRFGEFRKKLIGDSAMDEAIKKGLERYFKKLGC